MIRVAVAEEQRIARWALAEAPGKNVDLEIVGRAGTVGDTLAMVRKVKPEVLVVDTTIPDHSGFDLLAQLRDITAGPFILVLAPFAELVIMRSLAMIFPTACATVSPAPKGGPRGLWSREEP